MKKKFWFNLTLGVVLLSLLITSLGGCIAEDDGSNVGNVGNVGENDVTTEDPNGENTTAATTEDPKENKPILSDLNRDGTDDQILIAYNNEEESAATIKVINGKDSTVLMSETVELNSGESGAYYLKKSKNAVGEYTGYDCLVFWSHSYLDNGQLCFKFRVLFFDNEGNIEYEENTIKHFAVSSEAAILANNYNFLMLQDDVNSNISERAASEAYLLLDYQKDKLIISTSGNMIKPTELAFSLEDFAVKSDE